MKRFFQFLLIYLLAPIYCIPGSFFILEFDEAPRWAWSFPVSITYFFLTGIAFTGWEQSRADLLNWYLVLVLGMSAFRLLWMLAHDTFLEIWPSIKRVNAFLEGE